MRLLYITTLILLLCFKWSYCYEFLHRLNITNLPENTPRKLQENILPVWRRPVEGLGTKLFDRSPLVKILNKAIALGDDNDEDLQETLGETGEDIKTMLKFANYELGSELFLTKNDDLALSPEAVCQLFRNNTVNLVKELFKDNLFLQNWLTSVVDRQILERKPYLRDVLVEYTIPITELEKLVVAGEIENDVYKRSKRDLRSLKTSLQNVIFHVVNVLLRFYIYDMPSNPILALIAKVSNCIVFVIAKGLVTLLYL